MGIAVFRQADMGECLREVKSFAFGPHCNHAPSLLQEDTLFTTYIRVLPFVQ